MATEYGYRLDDEDIFPGWKREKVIGYIKHDARYVLISREVSEPRIVSIRA